MATIEEGLGPKTAREAGVKGGINVGGGGTAKDVGFGGSSTNTVGEPQAPAQATGGAPVVGQDAKAAQAFGANAQRNATRTAAAMAGDPANRNVFQRANDLMTARATAAFARGGDVNTKGLYKALHAMGYKTDGMKVLKNMSNADALSGMYDRLKAQAQAKANGMVRAGTDGVNRNVPNAQQVAANAVASAPKNYFMSKPPSYAQGGGSGDMPWTDIGGVSVQMRGVDVNDPAAVDKFRSGIQDEISAMDAMA